MATLSNLDTPRLRHGYVRSPLAGVGLGARGVGHRSGKHAQMYPGGLTGGWPRNQALGWIRAATRMRQIGRELQLTIVRVNTGHAY